MLTQNLGELVASTKAYGIDSSARDAAKRGVIDSIATMMAGRVEHAVALLSRAYKPFTKGDAIEIFECDLVGTDAAALINATAAHVLDFDDVSLKGHPSAVMVPALLALAQERNAKGSELLDAYVVGYQVWGELAQRESDMHHMKGWHPTGIFGSVGAAAACARLLRLDAGAAAHAIGLGATQSAGLMANFGSMAKSFQAGRAAQAGIMAAKLAQQGFTAGADVLNHSQGFLQAFSPFGRVTRSAEIAEVGKEWTIQSQPMSIKKYPTCYYTHRTIDSILALVKDVDVSEEMINCVKVHISSEHATVLCNHQPRTGLEAKFSIEFAAACALLHSRVSLADLTDTVVLNPRMQALMSRVETVHATEYSEQWQGAAKADWVEILLADGRTLETEPVVYAAGHASRPLAREDLNEKFTSCARAGSMEIDSVEILDRLWNLEQENIDSLWSGLCG
ncbi:MmgE/PrpD family protein [Allopusillimonas soli]|uniref:MmgE/PrpD family protein n=1 Tax=Allopusillimonas soli TaxID=659016 RepID=UPI001FD6DAE8|nr:MmgE/PrpD family protein [Allopusillimonas soli]